MLPDADDFPSVFLEFPIASAVSLLVGGHFRVPKLRICLRTGVARGASMPKAAVNEDDNTLLAEAKIRGAQHSEVPTPS